MKLYLIYLTFFILSLMLSWSSSSPMSDSKRNCEMNCDVQEYSPVCGTDDAGKTKTFNNLCTLKTENCLRTTTFSKTGEGTCP